MQTILIASLALNMFLIGVIIYLYRTEDKRRRKRELKTLPREIFKGGHRVRIRYGYLLSNFAC